MEIKKWFNLSLVVLVILAALLPVKAIADTEEQIEIANANELALIGHDDGYPLDGDYVQTGNIDLSGIAWTPIGETDLEPFTGTFNGSGYAINNLQIIQPSWYYIGLFGHLASGGIIQNVRLYHASVQGKEDVGALVGVNEGIIHSTEVVDSDIKGFFNVGGLVGKNKGEIQISSVIGTSETTLTTVTAENIEEYESIDDPFPFEGIGVDNYVGVGGLAGANLGLIQDSNVTNSDVISKSDGNHAIGGLAGLNFGDIDTSYVRDTDVNGSVNAGGLVGMNFASIASSSVLGGGVKSQSGVGATGGLVGINLQDITHSSVTMSVVEGVYGVGGITGMSVGDISSSSAQVYVKGTSAIGGIVGYNTGNVSEVLVEAGSVVEGVEAVGGVLGHNEGTLIYSKVKNIEVFGDSAVGGLVGSNSGNINIASVKLSGINANDLENEIAENIGGLVGDHLVNGIIGNSYAAYNIVVGKNHIGGLVGKTEGTIQFSYAVNYPTDITGDIMGPLVGLHDSGDIIASYYDSLVYGDDASTGMALITGEMGQIQTYQQGDEAEHWDFEGTWRVVPGLFYPQLYWELSDDKSLDTLSVDSGTLTPEFSPDEYVYTLSVPYSTSSISVTASVYDPTAIVMINNSPKGTSGTEEINLAVGDNDIQIEVTAENQSTTTYTLTADRAPAPVSDQPADDDQVQLPQTSKETRKTVVVTGNDEDGNNNIEVEITRDHEMDGSIVDTIEINDVQIDSIIKQSSANGTKSMRVLFSDLPDEPADEVHVELSAASLQKMKDAELELIVEVNGLILSLFQESVSLLAGDEEDIYFRIIPIRDAEKQLAVKERIVASDELVEFMQGKPNQIVGHPIIIETNYTNRKTMIILPFEGIDLPTDPQDRAAYLSELVVFIEHSDGEKVVQQGQIIWDDINDIAQGIEIEVDKFSTFTIIHAPIEKTIVNYDSYISGYPDGTFRPSQAITRAELATILSRHAAEEEFSSHDQISYYSDLGEDFWAFNAIQLLHDNGIMIGDDQGDFRPNAEVSRAEMAVVVLNWLHSNESEVFDDVIEYNDTQEHWAYEAISYVRTNGYMIGYSDGSFLPDQALTRAEAVIVLNLMTERPPYYDLEAATWSDVSLTNWASGDIESASRTFELEE